MASKSFVFRFGDAEVREREFSLVKAGETLSVEPKAFRVLLILLRNPGKLISKEELLNAVWGDAAVTEGSLTRCIWLLRSLLGDETRNPRYIETVATVGYRLVCPVAAVEDPVGVVTAPFLLFGLDQGLFRISVKGGKEERVVAMTDWHLTGHYGYSLSLDPTDAPLVLRDVGSDDIYTLALGTVGPRGSRFFDLPMSRSANGSSRTSTSSNLKTQANGDKANGDPIGTKKPVVLYVCARLAISAGEWAWTQYPF
jgi:DNA-binding winged helix-turn-helix (wHTH) protein